MNLSIIQVKNIVNPGNSEYAKKVHELLKKYGTIGILIVSLVTGIVSARNGKFIDEGDNLVVGLLIGKGQILYRDIFSHHFPFPYYWTAAAIGLVGQSIIGVRIAFWVFEILLIGLAQRYSPNRLAISLFTLLWSLIRVYFLANLILYHAFSGLFLTVIFILVISVDHTSETSRWFALFLGFVIAAALLTDPFNIYPVFFAVAILLVKKPKTGWFVIVCGSIFILIYLIYLLGTSTLQDFILNGIRFNTDVYSKYRPMQVSKHSQILNNLKTLFGLINLRQWDFSLLPMKNRFENWVLGGFLLRTAFVGGFLVYLLKRETPNALLLLGFGLVLVSNEHEAMRMVSFVMISLLALLLIICQAHTGQSERIVWSICRLALGVGLLGAVSWILGGEMRNYHDTAQAVENLELKGDRIRAAACDTEQVLLVDYPGGTYSYWFSGYQPATRFLFFWPWAAKVGQEQVISALDDEKAAPVMVRIADARVWNKYPTSEYLAALLSFLKNNYIAAPDGWYFSPGLIEHCPVATAPNPPG